MLRGRGEPAASPALAVPDVEPGALARAVTSSVKNILNVCGFVVIFSALTSALEASGTLPRLAGNSPSALVLSSALRGR